MSRLLPMLASLLLVGALAGATAPASAGLTTTSSAGPDAPASTPDAAADSSVGAPVTAPHLAARPVVPHPNTTAILRLQGAPGRSDVGSTGLDVAGAMAVEGAAVRGRFERLRVEHRYEAASSTAERRNAVEAGTEHIEARAAALRERDRRARQAFADGSLSTAAYLRRLAVVGVAAEELDQTTTVLGRQIDAVGDEPVSTARVARVRADLVGLHGPVRDRVDRAAAGQVGPIRVAVETDGDGLVLATVAGGGSDWEYVRSASVPGARNESLDNQFAAGGEPPLDAADARARELYPWAFENRQGFSVGRLGGPSLQLADVYPVTVDHRHGTVRQGDLVTYLDGGTTDAFREVQFLSAEALPRRSLGRVQSDGVSLGVNVTRPGGPMLVRVTNATGDPVDARLYVNGERAGSVGTDGDRWLVAPTGGVNVTAVDDGRTVTVTGSV